MATVLWRLLVSDSVQRRCRSPIDMVGLRLPMLLDWQAGHGKSLVSFLTDPAGLEEQVYLRLPLDHRHPMVQLQPMEADDRLVDL